MKKRLVSILLVLVMVLGMLPTVAFAADTAATRISTEAEFVAMEAGGNYILDTDITITKPHSGDFQGHFDGNGYTITLSGMTSSPFGIVNGPIHILKDIGLSVNLSYKLIENLDLLLSISIFVFDCLVDCDFFYKSIE